MQEEIKVENKEVSKDATMEEVKKEMRKYSRRKSNIIKGSEKTGRNELCPCGSKIKYKKCCLKKQLEQLEIFNQAQRAIESAEKKTVE
jgi:preprotein translocase subunit SecA